jgi:hypothetical protein
VSKHITLELPDDTFQHAERLAKRVRRDIRDVLVEAVVDGLLILPVAAEPEIPLTDLPDDEVLRLVDMRMSAADDERLSELQDFQQDRELRASEREALRRLMGIYAEGTLRKAEAMVEAVRRGLRPRLDA